MEGQEKGTARCSAQTLTCMHAALGDVTKPFWEGAVLLETYDMLALVLHSETPATHMRTFVS